MKSFGKAKDKSNDPETSTVSEGEKMKLIYGEDLQKRIDAKEIDIDGAIEKLIKAAIEQGQTSTEESRARLGKNPTILSFANKKEEFVVVFNDAKYGTVKVSVSK